MTVHELRQPLPERIETLEQAVAALRLSPNPDHHDGAYLIGWVEGGVAGVVFALTGGMPAELAQPLAESYATTLAPLPFASALAARPSRGLWTDSLGTYTARALRHIGRLSGFRAEAAQAREVAECPACGRLNVVDLHDTRYCPTDRVWLCSGERTCWGLLCDGDSHARCRQAVRGI